MPTLMFEGSCSLIFFISDRGEPPLIHARRLA